MNDYKSDIDIAMHIAHHQFFWEKISENESNGVTWQRRDYTHYVTAQLTHELIIADFLNSFRQARAGPARPARQCPTPNDRSRGPPTSREDERVEQIRSNIAERFKKSMRKAAQKESRTSVDISSSETETMAQPVKPILAKAMPQKGRRNPKSRKALPQHPAPLHPLPSQPQSRRRKTDVNLLDYPLLSVRRLPALGNFLRMQMLPKKYFLNLNKNVPKFNGFSVQKDHNVARILVNA